MEEKAYNNKCRKKYKWYTCEDCGKPILRRSRCDRHKLCTDCAARRMTQACRELHSERILRINKERGNKHDGHDSG